MNDTAKLELHPPAFRCGDCRFETDLSGEWSVKDGRLVFTADADPQPRRGPDLEGCCESGAVIFNRISAYRGKGTYQTISGADLEALRETARTSALDDWAGRKDD